MSQSDYGYFDENLNEYVITRPDTPIPWINYLGFKDYLGIVSNTAGGYSFYRDARLRRISRYFNNAIPKDNPGRYIYVCDGNKVWNPGFKPCKTKLDHYQCNHGLGYSIISGKIDGLEAKTTYFVPVDMDLEIWLVELINDSNTVKHIDLFSYIEFCLWNALDDFTNFQRNWNIGEVEIENNTVFHKTEYRERRNHYSYFYSSENIIGFDTNRDEFIGNMNDYSSPETVRNRKSKNSIAHGWAPIGSHHIAMTLEPGTTKKCYFVLGYIENPENQKFVAPNVINKKIFYECIDNLKTIGQVESKLCQLKQYWREILSKYQVEIDNDSVRYMVNTWNQYQCMVTFNVSRSVSFFEAGIGRGIGFRDSNQDILGSVHIVGDRSRQRIIDLASTQNSNGSCFHQYQPLTKKGNHEMGTGFSDDALWLIVSTSAYIRETGDWSILDASAGYADIEGNIRDFKLIDHLHKSVQLVLENRGPHDLPLIGHADWNDCLNLNCFSHTPGENYQQAGDAHDGVAESVMVAQLFVYSVKDFIKILKHKGEAHKVREYEQAVAKMVIAILKHGWDGKWFRRAYDHFSNPVGSAECEEGRIFIETQGWGVMAGIGLEDGKARQALDSAWEYLGDKNGMVLNQPAYTSYQDRLGEITSYPPGYKENASIFCHNNTWMIIAETIIGRGDKAWELFKRICPVSKQENIDVYKCEPYCFAQTISGKDSPMPGEAKNSWLTGSASWAFTAMTQYILGIRPVFDGLCIDPCVPADLKGFKVKRRFRNCLYDIEVTNPNAVMKGIKHVKVNGNIIQGNIVPVFQTDSVRIEVEMG